MQRKSSVNSPAFLPLVTDTRQPEVRARHLPAAGSNVFILPANCTRRLARPGGHVANARPRGASQRCRAWVSHRRLPAASL